LESLYKIEQLWKTEPRPAGRRAVIDMRQQSELEKTIARRKKPWADDSVSALCESWAVSEVRIAVTPDGSAEHHRTAALPCPSKV
jgi:hypothetical protein